jgi:hypothetical protein
MSKVSNLTENLQLPSKERPADREFTIAFQATTGVIVPQSDQELELSISSPLTTRERRAADREFTIAFQATTGVIVPQSDQEQELSISSPPTSRERRFEFYVGLF